MDQIVQTATVIATVGSGLMAGLFFSFSVCVMTALGRIPTAAGIAAMQSINRTILNPVFGVIFGGTTMLGLLVALAAPFADLAGDGWRIAGGVLAVAGTFLVTVTRNVPLNDRLDAVDPTGTAGERVWRTYLTQWTAWNHLRTVLCIAATAALAIGLRT